MNLNRHVNTWHTGRVFPADVRQALDQLFQQNELPASTANDTRWSPRVDIREDEQRFVIEADIPGVDPAQIEVSMDKGVLSIKGERGVGESSSQGKFSRLERARGSFHRHFSLPDSADAEGIVANGKLGVLEIVIPKKAQATPRRITINASH
ncbi:MAG: Hsp20/alpha crystallin family protein [Pseudomonadota bacterium]|nr:Hsp20/alpha crystallin family protein [Pseudomonadota bacterium]